MTTWHVRLCNSKVKNNRVQTYMREHFACEHDLIVISFGIRMDITNLAREDLKDHLTKVYLNRQGGGSKISSMSNYLTQIERFRDNIEIGDIVISPFYKLADKKSRIGIINSESKPLETFFGQSFSSIINAHVNTHGIDYFIDPTKPAEDEHRFLPARRVAWLTGFIDNSFLENGISTQIVKEAGLGTTIMIKSMPH